MFSEELRPLKRPKLGYPDFYPQEKGQKEDDLSLSNLSHGFRQPPGFPDEVGSALQEMQHARAADFTARIHQIVDQKKKTAWSQDSQKKRTHLSRDNFWPVPVGRNKKEQASHWFIELAGSETPLEQLVKKKIPIFNKREEIFDVLFEKNVPIFRAVWYIKMTAAYLCLGAESRLPSTKKKQLTDPSFEWTVSLTKFMQECVWRISNETQVSQSRHDSASSYKSSNTAPSEESIVELSKWKYMTELSSWLYQENLLDRQEFLRWLVERIETSKPSDEKSLALYLPLALKYLADISECVYLARPLVNLCCQKFLSFNELQNKVQNLINKKSAAAASNKDANIKVEPMETTDDDDVFTATPTKAGSRSKGDKDGKAPDTPVAAGRKRNSKSSLTVTIETPTTSTPGSAPGNQGTEEPSGPPCSHHASLIVQLSCIIQMMAIQCPTAYIHVSLTGKGAPRDCPKATTPLNKLPMKLSEMPLPKRLSEGTDKKLESALNLAEQEIRSRTKTAESGWSSTAMADLQTSNKGTLVQQTLQVLDILDNHSFTTCKYHSPLSTLFAKIVQKNTELLKTSSDCVCMLLCQWAVTPHRHGIHRPLVAARILHQLQLYIFNNEAAHYNLDLDVLDEAWDQPSSHHSTLRDTVTFPFQQTLFQFLDKRAPTPDNLYQPLKSSDSFKSLLILFSELIHLNVFSYSLYLSTLVARGETTHPIMPLLPFITGERTRPLPSPMESEELSLTVSYPSYFFDSKASQKKPEAKHEDDTISPTLPDRFGSQANLWQPAEVGFTPSHFGPTDSSGMKDKDEDMFRAEQLKLLEMSDPMEEGTSQLVSPIDFDSHPSSPMDFSLGFLEGTSPGLSESNNPSITAPPPTTNTPPTSLPRLNKDTSKHLLYASYLPVNPTEISRQELNERSVVLCGTGLSRLQIDAKIKEMRSRAGEIFIQLEAESSLVLSDATADFMSDFSMMPTFEQNYIACSCAEQLSSLCQGEGGGFPSCSQLVFVCTMLECVGAYHTLMNMLIDVIDHREGVDKRGVALPAVLCFPVVSLLWQYFSVLVLSLHDTFVVYEGLLRVLEGKKTKLSSFQKCVYQFLQHLQNSCKFIQSTYPSLPIHAADYCVPLVVDIAIQSATNILQGYIHTCLNNSVFAGGRVSDSHASGCTIQVMNLLQSNPKNSFFFVCEILSMATQKTISHKSLVILAHTCSELCSQIDRVPRELLGALRAMCIPGTVYKACATGYSSLTSKVNIITEPSIHGNLIVFMGLLLSFNCFTVHDVVTYIIKPMFKVYLLYPQGSGIHKGNAQNGSQSLEFVSLILRHLLVDSYIRGEHLSEEENKGIKFPQFVCHFLLTKSQRLSFDTILNLLKELLKLCKDTLKPSRGTTISSKTGSGSGMSILVESYPSGSEGNEAALIKLRQTLELIAQQSWVREQCGRQGSKHLLESDRLGDASLSSSQAQYLLHLLVPYCTMDVSGSVTDSDGSLPAHMTDHNMIVSRILNNLNQWTLRNALLHLQIIIEMFAKNTSHGGSQLDYLAQCIIQVFESSCSDEWLGQTLGGDDDSCVVDGAVSPPIWLVTPLVSKLPKALLGRILKNAGNVLGRGQWWNPEKSQEKRRATRNSAGTPSPKTGLQWQQPFLELVMACMQSHHSNHDELLGPLQKQLTTFLTAFEKEGMPVEEQNKAMLHAALKLRLGLVGSMLVSVCVTESSILEWVSLLVQLICSGSVDRQPDNSCLFTNCLDMLNALLQALTPDFLMCMVSGGEEGKKNYITCIKKMKADLTNSKSSCKSEIQQLFPLPQKAYEVTIVKPPTFTQHVRSTEKVQGLRVQETKEISPWEIIEGTKNSNPLQLSWFGAMRMKRRPLKFLQQHRLVIHHTHQSDETTPITTPHFSLLPEAPSQQQQPALEKGPDLKTEGDLPTQKGMPPESLQILRAIQQKQTASNAASRPGPLPSNIRPISSGPNPIPQTAYMSPTMGRGMSMSGGPGMMNPQLRHMMELLSPEQRNHINQLPQEKRGQYIQLMMQRRLAQRQQQQQQQRMQVHMMQRGGPGGFPRPAMHIGGGPMQANPPVPMNVLQQQRQYMYSQRGVPPHSHGQFNMMGSGHMGQGGMFRQPGPGVPPGHMYGMQRPHMFH